jgi:23S rRNA (cytidine1920-2'-O)/16S rRNA (cytidine1409-2'-O)-methyltransferase
VTRSRARSLIIAGRVRVDGRPATKPGTSIAPSAVLDVERARPFVSRGGEKLEGALERFALDVTGLRALDVGASTGGFTDCLLQRGARHVTALDVGYGQLALSVRDDPRVTVVERTNFRLVEPGSLGEPFDIITIDASFISVVTIVDRARAFLADDGAVVAIGSVPEASCATSRSIARSSVRCAMRSRVSASCPCGSARAVFAVPPATSNSLR